jgi:hypothetical protein
MTVSCIVRAREQHERTSHEHSLPTAGLRDDCGDAARVVGEEAGEVVHDACLMVLNNMSCLLLRESFVAPAGGV